MVTRAEVVQEARKWLGVPWRHQGRSETGLDCAGLVLRVAWALQLLPDTVDEKGYDRRPNGFSFLGVFREHAVEKPILARQPGDMILIADGPYPCHVALMSEKYGVEHVVHASVRLGKVMEEPFIHDLPLKATHCFQYRGIED